MIVGLKTSVLSFHTEIVILTIDFAYFHFFSSSLHLNLMEGRFKSSK